MRVEHELGPARSLARFSDLSSGPLSIADGLHRSPTGLREVEDRMLVARLRSDNPLGDAPITLDEQGMTFVLGRVGEITSAKLLDLENRRQLVWVDDAKRELAMGTAISRVRGEAANRAQARAEAAAAAAVALAHGAAGKERGISAAPTKFEVPGGTARKGSRVIWNGSSTAEPKPNRAHGRVSPRRRHSWAWAIASVACVVAVALGLRFSHQIAHQLALSFTRQATPYTELYLTDPKALPTTLAVPGPNLFTFTVSNHERREHVYAYVVTLTGPQGTSAIERGTIDLKDGMKASRVVDVVTPESHAVYLIKVTIADPLETVDFRGRT